MCAAVSVVTGVPSALSRRHLNGTAWPALTTLRTGGLSTGELKPTKSQVLKSGGEKPERLRPDPLAGSGETSSVHLISQ